MTDYIGKYVKQFESGKLGSLALGSSGYDWGLSCGSYQLTLRWGNCIKFLIQYFPKDTAGLYYSNKDFPSKEWPGVAYCTSPEVVKSIWTKCYNKVGADKFFEYEHEYMKKNFYDQIKAKIIDYIDLDNASRAFQECFWSWAIHRGVNGAYSDFIASIQNRNFKTISKESLFDLLYDKRYSNTKIDRYKKNNPNGEREILRKLLNVKGFGVIKPTGGGKMKYSNTNKPLVCMMTQSTCYKGTTPMKVKGVLWHSTGANNPTLKRYVQPDDDATNKQELLDLIGVNIYQNDMNHIYRTMGMNCWIGKMADGTVSTVQTLPWDWRPWGCGSGPKGSCNDGWIQFEICEDALTSRQYFEDIYEEACQITAYLCNMFDIDPLRTVEHNGVKVPTILCHKDSYDLGLGGNHGDIYHWFPKFGKTMEDARNDVAKLLPKKETPKVEVVVEHPNLKVGDEIYLIENAKYSNGKSIPQWVIDSKLYLRLILTDGNYIISTKKTGAITGIVSPDQILLDKNPKEEVFKPYRVQITAFTLNVRQEPTILSKVTTQIKKNQIYTIVEEDSGWGKLKSGAGWINLKYVKKYEKK